MEFADRIIISLYYVGAMALGIAILLSVRKLKRADKLADRRRLQSQVAAKEVTEILTKYATNLTSEPGIRHGLESVHALLNVDQGPGFIE